jgi:hypothetical protein
MGIRKRLPQPGQQLARVSHCYSKALNSKLPDEKLTS